MSDQKTKALELAIQAGGSPTEIVNRAQAYWSFIVSAGDPSASAGATNPNTTGATAGATPAGKDPAKEAKAKAAAEAKAAKEKAAADAKAAAEKVAADLKAAAEAKAAAGKANTAKPNGKATAATVDGETRAPGGKNNYNDVIAKLRAAMAALDPVAAVGKQKALDLMAKAGGGATSVRELKPALYDAVVAACDAALNEGDPPEGGSGDPDFDDGTKQPAVDELGFAVE